MIISHKYKFIFFKVRKTAGTSLQFALSNFCGPDDVISQGTIRDRFVGSQAGYCSEPQNYDTASWLPRYKRYSPLLRRTNSVSLGSHSNARTVRGSLNRNLWNSYYKFCVERNPFDKLISYYYWSIYPHAGNPELFDYYLDHYRSSWMNLKARNIYLARGKVAVDKIFRYENLEAELKTLVERLGLPKKLELPQLKNIKRPKIDRWSFFNDRQRRFVEKEFAFELKLMDYHF